MSEILCRCGNPAIYNKKEDCYEVCCECRGKILSEDYFRRLKTCYNIPEVYHSASLSDFKPEVVAEIMLSSDDFHKNILLIGNSFVGKTYFLTSIVDKIIRKRGNKPLKIKFVNVKLMFKQLNNLEDMTEEFEDYSNAQLLILDEIPDLSKCNDYCLDFLHNILERRHQNNKTTHSSTNIEVKDARIKSRLLRGGMEINLTKNSWR